MTEDSYAKLLLEGANCWHCVIQRRIIFEFTVTATEILKNFGCRGAIGEDKGGQGVFIAPSPQLCENYKRDMQR